MSDCGASGSAERGGREARQEQTGAWPGLPAGLFGKGRGRITGGKPEDLRQVQRPPAAAWPICSRQLNPSATTTVSPGAARTAGRITRSPRPCDTSYR